MSPGLPSGEDEWETGAIWIVTVRSKKRKRRGEMGITRSEKKRGAGKTVTIFLFAVLFAVFFLSGQGHASLVSASGQALIDWSLVSFSGPALQWTDPGGMDMRNSFSGIHAQLNGNETVLADSNYFEGGWVSTSTTANLSDSSGHVNALASTGTTAFDPTNPTAPATQAFGSHDILLNAIGSADVFVSQGVLSGGFFATATGLLTITVPYHLEQSLNSTTPYASVLGDVAVALALSEFDMYANIVGTADAKASDIFAIGGPGSYSFLKDGSLALSYALTEGTYYEFEASGSTLASASAVPVPPALYLLGCGIMAMGILRRRFF
jgi:hypothetical protein